jgi:mannosyltransferase OCH1-like enzyme
MTPKIIHQIVGPAPSALIKRCLASWAALTEEGFEIRIWNDESLALFIGENYAFALDAFINARNHAEASDIARYLIIHRFGGYYVDWDILLFNSLGFLSLASSNRTGYLLIDKKNLTLASEHFAAPAGEAYLLHLVHDIIHTYERGERELMETPQYSGPYRMKIAYQRYRITQQTVIDVKDIFEYDYSEIRQASVYGRNKLMIHFWGHSWIAGEHQNLFID